MNDEIKEILECMEEIADCTFTTDTFELNFEDTKQLLDYITNLQQENERLSKELLKYDELLLKRNCQIIKAIEYIDKQKKKMYKSRNKIAMFILMKLKNILQNGSDDNE